MKKIIVTLLISASLGLSACQDTFLQMPDTTGTVDLNEVYGSAKNAKSALMTCYREALIHGLPGGWGVGHGTLGAISGEISRGYSWHGTYTISQSGLDVNGTDGSDAGSDHFGNNWAYIRHCFTVRENIDRVPDMSDQEKNYVKAEATALVAYRYMGMFYRYGGLPIVRGSFSNPADRGFSPAGHRSKRRWSIFSKLCQQAYDGLPEGDWGAADQGRMTRGAVLAIKARTLLFAARPLFNSATPYLSGGHDDLVCFGSKSDDRWQDAIEANEAVLTWAAANNYACSIPAVPVRATLTPRPSKTMLRQLRRLPTGRCCWPTNATRPVSGRGPEAPSSTTITTLRFGRTTVGYRCERCIDQLSEALLQSRRIGIHELAWCERSRSAGCFGVDSEYRDIEPRAKADNMFVGFDAFNNPGHSSWSANNWGRQVSNAARRPISRPPSRPGRGAPRGQILL